MPKKTLILRIAGALVFLLGLFIVIVIVPFINSITRGDTSWFVNRFSPDGTEAWETYENLYQMAFNFAESVSRHAFLLNMSFGISLLIIGIILFLWGRDLKRYRETSKH